MRDDMFKVIVERPRWGSRWIESPKLDRDKYRDRGSIGLRRHVKEQKRAHKGFNENLAPLARFLRSRCGRRWDDVYAEICANLDTGSTVKMHVRQHLDDLVHRRISYGRKGELLNDGWMLKQGPGKSVWDDLYVDPDDGILKNAELNTVANRTLISDETNGKIKDKAPAEYVSDADIFPSGPGPELLEPHFIDARTLTHLHGALEELPNDEAVELYARFVGDRQAAIVTEIRRVCGITQAPAGTVEEEEDLDEVAADVRDGTAPPDESEDALFEAA